VKLYLVLLLLALAGVVNGQQPSKSPSAKPQQGSAPTQLSNQELTNIAMQISSANSGILISVGKQPELDADAVRVNFEEVGESVARADVMRVVLQCISKLAPIHPSLVNFASKGQERLLLDGKDLSDIAFQFDNDKAVPAWRLFAERATRPDGSKISLPEGLLPRTTASFALADELIKGAAAGQAAKSSQNADSTEKIKKADKWQPKDENDHGEIVTRIISSVRATPVKVLDGSRLDYRQVEQLMGMLLNAVRKGITDSKVALQQNEQGQNVEVPEGSSELYDVRLKFRELFNVTDDNILLPITAEIALRAPESTFAGITVYGKKLEVKGRITGKYKEWHSGVSQYSSGGSYYTEHFEIEGRSSRLSPVANEILVRWGDIKDKIAFDMSDKKYDEDREMERQALARQ
jgi:hypothetical protein